jgi:hydrogenase nickel incorporation protein HypB
MCATCGCSDDAKATVTDLESGATRPIEAHAHHHHHEHAHPHEHDHEHGGHTHHPVHAVALEADILAKNNRLAERNRRWFEGRNILALNLVSAPGAGKTRLLERTIRDLNDELLVSVIEGDQATLNDAERIRATGSKVVQINTGAGCHLDAEMVARGLKALAPPLDSMVIIENVGNLVCPALFDLGEAAKVMILSVTEGDDKPVKYPHMFRASEVLILNKIDLLPYVDFDVDRCIEHARAVSPEIKVLQISATKGEGLKGWYEWVRAQVDDEAKLRLEDVEGAAAQELQQLHQHR